MRVLEMLPLFLMMPVLGWWYFYTIADPERAARRADQDAVSRDPESVRLPRRRRFPHRLSRRPGMEFRSVRGQPQRVGSPRMAHPMWDRWIDG